MNLCSLFLCFHRIHDCYFVKPNSLKSKQEVWIHIWTKYYKQPECQINTSNFSPPHIPYYFNYFFQISSTAHPTNLIQFGFAFVACHWISGKSSCFMPRATTAAAAPPADGEAPTPIYSSKCMFSSTQSVSSSVLIGQQQTSGDGVHALNRQIWTSIFENSELRDKKFKLFTHG